ncbi:pyruvate, phosphate dikinase, partial [bacterium]|nr:pyruvate, phosphate dikinase [bacterium]
MTQYVYTFGDGKAQGNATMKNVLGGKGANLAEMNNIDVPVPPGFTISTEVCTHFYQNNHEYPKQLKGQVKEAVINVEKIMKARYGDSKNPLLLSVRSGARVSMPGMMDTVLNMGLNDETVVGLIEQSGDEWFAYDSYRRFVQMYSGVVMGMEGDILRTMLDDKKEELGIKLDSEFSIDNLKLLVTEFKKKVQEETGQQFPDDPEEQIWGGIGAVFKSWMTRRAVEYRRINDIPGHWGTAVNVQAMVFGNMGNDCATGVAFTRDPSTGKNVFMGEFLINAQGEDVVAGVRTPQPINIECKGGSDLISLEEVMPKQYKELEKIYLKLEKHYKDMQDIEFTIQKGKLWMLQTRNGKRTANAAVKIAIDMANEKLLTKQEAVKRVDANQLDQLLHPMIDPKAPKEVLAKGLPASPGAAVGQVVFNAHDAGEWVNDGKKVILTRLETSPDDIHGMNVAQGILTARGGMTSHAAVVARGMGKCCVSGCEAMKINYANKQFSIGNITVKEGDWITLDGSTGEVMLGQMPTIEPQLTGEFGTLMEWADEFRKMGVRTNADTPKDAETARRFGAEGIGLCRTEHMFFDGDRIDAVREMILAEDLDGRKVALAKILPMQKGDFKGIFRVMNGYPVTVRLLDPPLHEFLPHTQKEIDDLSRKINVPSDILKSRVDSLHEFNPMLGHRGCRLGVTYPEIYAMQTQAIMEAAAELIRDENVKVLPEIEIPLVGHVNELKILRAVCEKVCREVMDA